MANDKPGSTAGKSASPSQPSLADERSPQASEEPANRPSESRSSDETISVVGIGASAGGLESEMRFREFAENSADVFWIVDAADEKLEYLNRAYERIWGEARTEVMRDLVRWKAVAPSR